jgi:hypothetical protein
METNSTQQEILLLTNTSFSRRQWSEKDASDNNSSTDKEQLENACWNGMLKEILPEVFIQAAEGEELFLWQVIEASSFLELELGEHPEVIDKEYSINPYAFLAGKSCN